MAMNNWGGVTEHMTKKTRGLFANRDVIKRGKANSIPRLVLTKEELVRSESKKRKKLKKLGLLGVAMALVLFTLFYYLHLIIPNL